jgi:hypothetical protein
MTEREREERREREKVTFVNEKAKAFLIIGQREKREKRDNLV